MLPSTPRVDLRNLAGLTDAFQPRRNSPALVLTLLRCTAVVGDEFPGGENGEVDGFQNPPRNNPGKKLNRQFGKSWVSIQKLSSEVDESLVYFFVCMVFQERWQFGKVFNESGKTSQDGSLQIHENGAIKQAMFSQIGVLAIMFVNPETRTYLYSAFKGFSLENFNHSNVPPKKNQDGLKFEECQFFSRSLENTTPQFSEVCLVLSMFTLHLPSKKTQPKGKGIDGRFFHQMYQGFESLLRHLPSLVSSHSKWVRRMVVMV